MSSGTMRPHRHAMASAVFVLLIFPTIPTLRAQSWGLDKTRKIAESQHNIVMILIKKKEYPQAAEEANKIFQLKWPDDQEPLLLNELLGFADQFHSCHQLAIGVHLLESNISAFKTNRSKAEIWKAKGYLLERMGKHDEALASFREAQRLEKLEKHP